MGWVMREGEGVKGRGGGGTWGVEKAGRRGRERQWRRNCWGDTAPHAQFSHRHHPVIREGQGGAVVASFTPRHVRTATASRGR